MRDISTCQKQILNLIMANTPPFLSVFFFFFCFSLLFFSNFSHWYAGYFHAHMRRLHTLKAIYYDSKIISYDSSRRRRGRHPIKSYVAAPETAILNKSLLLLIRSSCVCAFRRICSFFPLFLFFSWASCLVSIFLKVIRQEEFFPYSRVTGIFFIFNNFASRRP